MTTTSHSDLVVELLGAGRYRVTGGAAPHIVTADDDSLTCDCADAAYRGRACKHVFRVTRFLADPQGPLIDQMSEDDVLDLLGPPAPAPALLRTVAAPLAPLSAPSGNGDGLTHIRDLLAEPDDAVSWIVEGLLPAGGLSVIVAKPKAGKSTTARAMALRVCRGERVLDRATTQGPVIYLGLEDPRRVTKGHLRTLGAQSDDDLYVWTGTRPDAALAWLEGVLATVDPVLVVVDTLQHLLGVSDLNDYARVVAALGPVLALVRPRRAHLMLVHHAGKGDRTGFDAILGSTGILGTVDTALLLRRRDDDTRTVATRQRTGEDLPESVLVLNDHQEPRLEGLRVDFDQRQAEGRVLDWLAKQADPVSRAEVLAGVEGDGTVNTRGLYALAKRGDQVRRTGRGVKGDPFLYSCIPLYPHAGMQEGESGRGSRNDATISRMPESDPVAIPSPTVMQETDPDQPAYRVPFPGEGA